MSKSEILRVSGKKFELPAPNASAAGGWKFTQRPGGWIIAESPTGERQRLLLSELRGALSANVGGKLLRGEVQKPAQRGGAQGSGGSDADLIAQFPGKVRKIVVEQGAQVVEGDPLILVEAMKMEFAIKAPFAGTVERFLVKEGEQISPGTRFLDLKPAGENGGK